MGNLGVEWVDGDFWVIDTAYSLSAADEVDLKFAYYLIGYVGLNHLKDGSSNPSLTREVFGTQLFPLPPLNEQQRIAGVLGALDDLVETDRAVVTRLEDAARRVAARATSGTDLSDIARAAAGKQTKPTGVVEHYSLPAFDNGAVPEIVDAAAIKSNKLRLTDPAVLVSRLNPRWERCWMIYPGDNAMSSTEFVPLVGRATTPEEVWAVTSSSAFWEQMRSLVTGTTGSHQRVDKGAVLTLAVPDVRELTNGDRQHIVDLVRAAYECRQEISELTSARDELLPLLMSGRVRVREVA